MRFESSGFGATQNTPRDGIAVLDTFMFEHIGEKQLPQAVAKEIEYLTSSGSNDRDLDIDIMLIKNPDNTRTFLYVENDRTIGSCFGEAVDEIEGDAIGHTSFGTMDDPAKKVFSVAFTATDGRFQGQGFGERRLLVINQYCKQHYGTPLCSDTSRQPSADALWQKLVKKGLAEKITMPNQGARYCFL